LGGESDWELMEKIKHNEKRREPVSPKPFRRWPGAFRNSPVNREWSGVNRCSMRLTSVFVRGDYQRCVSEMRNLREKKSQLSTQIPGSGQPIPLRKIGKK